MMNCMFYVIHQLPGSSGIDRDKSFFLEIIADLQFQRFVGQAIDEIGNPANCSQAPKIYRFQ